MEQAGVKKSMIKAIFCSTKGSLKIAHALLYGSRRGIFGRQQLIMQDYYYMYIFYI